MAGGRWVKGQSGNPGGRVGVPAEIRERLKAAAPEAIDLLISIATNEEKPDNLRMDCAKYLLDRAFGKPSQALSVDAAVGATVQTVQLTPDEMLSAIKEAAQNMGGDAVADNGTT